MKFRYKVVKTFGGSYCRSYNVSIQEYNDDSMLWKWRKVETHIDLREMLWKLNDDAFGSTSFWHLVNENELYKALQQYSSIEEIIMKYIYQYVLKKRKYFKDKRDICDLIDQFVLKDGWNTIEAKEY